jgi:tetratricopeptide (TPR) repeat protein
MDMTRNPSDLPLVDEITLLEQQVADGVATPDTHYALARAYYGQVRFAEAERHYIATLTADPDFASAYHDIGQLYLKQNRPADAHKALVRYMRLASTLEARRETLKQLTAMVGDEALICEGCGRKSPIAEAFQFKQDKLICPRCRMPKPKQGKAQFWNHSLFGMAMIGAIALLTSPIKDPFHFMVSNIFILLLWLPFILVIHEAAHALAALAMGGKVYAFIIGQGDTIWRKRVGDCEFLVRSDLQNGHARFGFPLKDDIKRKYFIAISAPLLVHLLIGVLGFQFLSFDTTSQSYEILHSFVFANILMFVFNAIPRKFRIDGWEQASDGAALLKIVQGKHTTEEMQLVSLTNESIALLDSQQGEKAIAILEKVVAHPKLPQYGRGMVENNFSWILLMAGQTKLALDHARCAYAILPWLPSIEGTLGGALIEMNLPQEGIPYLLQADEYTILPDHHASHFAHLALAYAQLGNPSESQRYWEQALKLDPDNEVVAHLRPKLAGLGIK